MANLPPDIQKIIDEESAKLLRQDFQKIIQKKFEELKAQLLNDFLNHPITQEILGGPTASNISDTLNGKGNLFSFIGFDQSDNPIEPILEILQNIQMTFDKDIKSGSQFSVNLPIPEDIFKVTPMPWANGRSWAKGIETGISGLGFYLYKTNSNSRSGEGIQTSVKLGNNIKFKNTAYISALLNTYKEKFSKIK